MQVSALKNKLKKQSTATGDGVARAFLRAQAALFGSYRDALRYKPVSNPHQLFWPLSTAPRMRQQKGNVSISRLTESSGLSFKPKTCASKIIFAATTNSCFISLHYRQPRFPWSSACHPLRVLDVEYLLLSELINYIQVFKITYLIFLSRHEAQQRVELNYSGVRADQSGR